MAEPDSQPRASPPSRFRWHFTLRGLMAFTFGVAVGLARFPDGTQSWEFWRFDMSVVPAEERLLAAASAWIMLGLLSQARDLWQAFRAQKNLSPDARFGWIYTAAWRLGLAMALVSLFVIDQLDERDIISFPRSDGDVWSFHENAREAMRYLIFIFTLMSVQRPRTLRANPSLLSRCVEVLGIIAILLLGLLRLIDIFTITGLIHIVVFALALNQPGELSIQPVGREFVENWNQFTRWTTLASFGALINWFSVMQLARRWSGAFAWRVLWGLALAAGLGACFAFAIWAYSSGLPSVSPFQAECLPLQFPHRWAFAFFLLSMLVTAATAKLIARYGTSVLEVGNLMRKGEGRYLHERCSVVLVLLTSVIVSRIRLYVNVSRILDDPIDALYEFSYSESPWLQIIVMCLAGRWLYLSWWRGETPRRVIGIVSSALFYTVWLGLFLTITAAIVAWGCLSFCIRVDDSWFQMFWPKSA